MEVLDRVRMMQRAEELVVVFLRKVMPSWGECGTLEWRAVCVIYMSA